MTLWTSVTIMLVFSFVVIALDEFFHWRRRQQKRERGGSAKDE